MKEGTLKALANLDTHDLKSAAEALAAEARSRWMGFVSAFSEGNLFKAQRMAWAQWLYATPEEVAQDREAMKDVWAAAYQSGATELGTEGDVFRAIEAYFKTRCDDQYFERHKKRINFKEMNQVDQEKARTWWNYVNSKQGWEWWANGI